MVVVTPDSLTRPPGDRTPIITALNEVNALGLIHRRSPGSSIVRGTQLGRIGQHPSRPARRATWSTPRRWPPCSRSVGIAPNVVAKHGVLGLSDVICADLAAVDALIGVSVLMPGMINTGMNPVGTVPASVVAANALDAIPRDRPYIFTDDHSTAAVERRLRAILAARGDVV